MIQVSLVGYGAGGAFLGLAYFDLTYHLMIALVLAAKFSGVLDKHSPAKIPLKSSKFPHPSSRFDQGGVGQRL